MLTKQSFNRCRSYRRSWAALLKDIISPAAWREVKQRVPLKPDGRRRWAVRLMVLAWLMIGWSGRGTLGERFQEAEEAVVALGPHRRRPGGSYAGLVKSSAAVGVTLFRSLWQTLRPAVLRRLARGPSSPWPWTVLAVDGSRFDAPRTRANEQALGCAGRDKSGPQWWVTWLVQLPTLVLWDWRQGPGSSSERGHLREMLADLPPEALVLGDAGFVGFPLLRALVDGERRFLVRCGSNVHLLLAEARQRLVGEGQDLRVYLWPAEHRRQRPLVLRLITVGSGKKRVYLLTNLLESVELSRRQAGQLYRERWGVEVGYRHLKQTLGRRRLRSTGPQAGAVELAANVLALALLLVQAAMVLGRRVARVSVAAALRAIRRALEALRYGTTSRLWSELSVAVRDDYRRRRPKRARDWPHRKKESPPGPPKCRTMNPREKACLARLLGQMVAGYS
jgi:hypothetical protein